VRKCSLLRRLWALSGPRSACKFMNGLQLRSLGIERAFPSAMVATDAVNLSVLWTDDRTALGESQLAARAMRSAKAARAPRGTHSNLPVGECLVDVDCRVAEPG